MSYKIVREYLNGRWETLESGFETPAEAERALLSQARDVANPGELDIIYEDRQTGEVEEVPLSYPAIMDLQKIIAEEQSDDRAEMVRSEMDGHNTW